ncbi:DUF3054 domain-containing protein [Leucobacter sp. gxy201]|uniref:DUF3054 domain-containing protein n=1 Tax=Leucobacter sp. gxy201 TaxID=2957200 RepID=UPI003DA17A29
MSTANAGRAVPTARTALLALLCDAALVLVFAASGRRSHARDATLVGLLQTAWPFLAGLGLMWLVLLAWRRPLSIVRIGIPLWLGTVLIGMLLRLVSGAGTALPFVLVATGAIGVLFIGWRAIALLALRLRGRRAE